MLQKPVVAVVCLSFMCNLEGIIVPHRQILSLYTALQDSAIWRTADNNVCANQRLSFFFTVSRILCHIKGMQTGKMLGSASTHKSNGNYYLHIQLVYIGVIVWLFVCVSICVTIWIYTAQCNIYLPVLHMYLCIYYLVLWNSYLYSCLICISRKFIKKEISH